MGNGFYTAGGRFRKLIGVSLLLAAFQSAWALDVMKGDFQQVLNTRSEVLAVWQMADNPSVYFKVGVLTGLPNLPSSKQQKRIRRYWAIRSLPDTLRQRVEHRLILPLGMMF